MSYRLTEAARQDIRDITSYIRTVQKSPQNARLVAERLKAQFTKLARTPSLGPSVRNSTTTPRASSPSAGC